jgi:hypothetical protein
LISFCFASWAVSIIASEHHLTPLTFAQCLATVSAFIGDASILADYMENNRTFFESLDI